MLNVAPDATCAVVAVLDVLNPTIVNPLLVIVGATTEQLVACVAPLYTAAIVHEALVLLNVAPFALNVAVYVIAFFLVIA